MITQEHPAKKWLKFLKRGDLNNAGTDTSDNGAEQGGM